MRFLRRALVGGSVGWALALPSATYVASLSHPTVGAYLLGLGVYFVGSVACHQLDARSFHLWEHQMPVCARCTGIYVGAALAAVAASVAQAFRPVAQVFRPATTRTVLALAALPAVATLVFEWTTGVTPSNAARAATGILLGAAVAWLAIYEIQ